MAPFNRKAQKSLNMQLLGETLTRHYRLACELYDTYPAGRFTNQLSQGNLDLSLSEVDLGHLEALCHVIQHKISPLCIHINISTEKEVGVKVIQRTLQGISVCLSVSQTLATLELYNIRLKGKNLDILCQGLVKSRNLKSLSLNKCDLGDVGVQNVCHSIKNIPSITHLSLIDCHLADKGASAVASLVQHQRMNRDSAMWQDTLRLRQPHLDGMRGLRRITLNHNPKLNDSGAAFIANALMEDLWIKALDLQHCGIGAEGGLLLRNILNANQTLEVLDLRQNPFIPSDLLDEVTEVLQGRWDDSNMQYMWLEPSEGKYVKQQEVSESGKSRGYSATRRISIFKKGSHHTVYFPPKKGPKPPGQLGVPWRVEHRLFERREGLAPGSMLDAFHKVQQSSNLVSNPPQQPDEEDVEGLTKVRKQLSLYKRKYQKERERRKHTEKKLTHLQARLEEIHFLDEETVSHIETCFMKFQTFLTHLQSTGFHWQSSSSEVKLQDGENGTKASNTSQTIVQAAASSEHTTFLSANAENFPPSDIPIPVIFVSKITESDPSSQGNCVETDNPLETVKIMKNPPVSFGLDFKPTENTLALTLNRKDDIMEELKKDIQNGRKMLSFQPKDVVLEENMEDIVQEKKVVDMNEIFSKVMKSYQKKKKALRKISHVQMYLKGKLEQGNYILCKNHVSDKTYCETVPKKCASNDEPLISENELGMTKCKLVHNDNETDEEDVPDYEQHSPLRCLEEKTERDISNHIRNKKIIRSELSELELKRQQEDTELNKSHMERNSPLNLNKKKHDSDEDSTSFIHKVKANEQISLFNKKKAVLVDIFQTSADEIHGYEETVTENQNSHVKEYSHGTDLAETDDEKLRMQKNSFQISNRSSSVSSVSITDHLSNSHFRWSKGSKKKSNKHGYSESNSCEAPKVEVTRSKDNGRVKHDKVNLGTHSPHFVKNENGLQDYGSDFEISDVEGISISASSLTTTSIPDDLLTPGEEEF
ncbi:LOW QUALITY PROTEIN: uncharacterized protein [Panulirus ornatus]|uniref:LOW QUALITY PROTEIN: uncharacterized protein n=1 Tax=Panulirus ornatus TaxID=150431 RepID=UPI003A89E482